MPHGWSATLVVAALAAGCGGSVINLFPDVPIGEDGGVDATPSDDLPPADDVARPDVGVDGGGNRCASNADCRTGQFCAGTGCGTAGTCQTRPQACPEIFSPVCGCDGRTYSSAECEANSNGVRVAYRGPCNATDAGVDAAIDARVDVPADGPVACGPADACPTGQSCCGFTGRCYPSACLGCCMFPPPDAAVDAPPAACRSNGDCRATQYCSGSGCGTPGTCATRPTACTTLYAPVCGCDGRTYGNECDAASGGMRVASRGVCASADAGVDVITAGCRSAADCTRGQECFYPSSACAASGTCSAAIACLRPETFCSCANETYQGCRPDRPTVSAGACPVSSFCAAVFCAAGTRCCETTRMCQPAGLLCPAAADAGVDAAPDVITAGCASNADCRDTQYCAGTGCGTRGTCMDRPGACTTLYAPVCGCDGVTYSNECVARGAGQRAATTGVCPTTGRCATATDCARGQECVYPTTACATSGTCTAAIACLIPNTYCSCANVTYQGCRPDRATRSTGACATTSFCATARCTATTYCCEAQRACIPLGTACSTTGACTNDSQCGGTGYACCAGTGRCYDVRCLACCMLEPSGCGSNADCRDTQYCAGMGCGTRGACADRPTICTRELNPQCGCNRMTYSNPCVAAAAGVRVAAAGACP